MLEASLVTLRQPLEEDIPVLVSLRNNLELQTKLMSLPRANTTQKVKNWLDSNLNNPQTVFFIIAENKTNQACGYIQLINMNFIHGFGELGICISPLAQNKGYGKEAVTLLEKYVIEIFKIRKIILKVLLDNQPAIYLYEKLGYQKVGVHYQHFYNRCQFYDVLIMEKLLDSSQQLLYWVNKVVK